MEEKVFANALNQSIQIGAGNLKKIKDCFGGFKKAWAAPFSKIQKIVNKKDFNQDFRLKIDPEKEFNLLEKENIKVLIYEDLPLLVQEICPCPQILYIKGDIPKENKVYLTVVGPRKFSSYGKEVCEKLVRELKDYNITIVSGLAFGIDSIAHKTALDNKMKTIAVLGNGLHNNVLYPQKNLHLSQEIIEKKGALVSEYPLYMKASTFTFPQRNRIAAGLSQGTLIIEAPEKSGSLITASLALEYNREVFAVPGGIFDANSKGVNNLIKMGALPITEADDILRALGIEPQNEIQNISLSPEEEKIVELLYEPMERDELIRKLNCPVQQINPLLSQMEIKGIIKEIGGKLYKL